MTERYVQLMEDVQYSRRETANWRQKYNSAEGIHPLTEFKYLLSKMRLNNYEIVWIDCNKATISFHSLIGSSTRRRILF